jgi:hypothetical protein
MKKEDELKLSGAALQKRIRYRENWARRLYLPFLCGGVVMIGGIVLVFIDKPNGLYWGLFALGGFLVGVLSVALGAWHAYRVTPLVVLAGGQTGIKSVDPKAAGAAKDLLKKDEGLDDDAFTPPAAIGYGEGHDGGHE